MDVSISAMNMTSHIHFVSVMDSPILTGKTLHRLGSFPQPAARRDEAWRGEAGGGGGARVDVPLVLMLIQVGKEPPL